MCCVKYLTMTFPVELPAKIGNPVPASQWRTQKIFMGGFGSRSYGGYLFLVCTVCDVTI